MLQTNFTHVKAVYVLTHYNCLIQVTEVCLLTLFLYEFESMLPVKNCAFVIKSCAFVDISEDRGYPLALMIDIWGHVLHHLGVCFTW